MVQILGRTFVVQPLVCIGSNTFFLGQQLEMVIHLRGANLTMKQCNENSPEHVDSNEPGH